MRVGTDVSEGSVSDIEDAIPQTPLPTIEDKLSYYQKTHGKSL